MQKCSLPISANNREISVIPRDLLAGFPPARMPHMEGNSPHTSVTELNAGEFRNKACTEEAVCNSSYFSYHSIAQIKKKSSFKTNSLVFSCIYLQLQLVKHIFRSPFSVKKEKTLKTNLFFQLLNPDFLQAYLKGPTRKLRKSPFSSKHILSQGALSG